MADNEYKDKNSSGKDNEDFFAKYDNLDELMYGKKKDKSNDFEKEKKAENHSVSKSGITRAFSVIRRILGIIILLFAFLFMAVSVDETAQYINLSKVGTAVDATVSEFVSEYENEYKYGVEYSLNGEKNTGICICSIEYDKGETLRAFVIEDESGIRLSECDNVDVGAYVGGLIAVIGIFLTFKNFWARLVGLVAFGGYSLWVSASCSQNNIVALTVLSFGIFMIHLIVIKLKGKFSKTQNQ